MRTFQAAVLILFVTTCSLAFPGKVIKAVQTPYACPTGLAFDGSHLWIADHMADRLSCLDLNGKTVREIPSPGFWPMGLAWDGKYLWNVDSRQKKIFKVDPDDGSVLRSIDSPTESPEGLAWDGHTLWVSDARAKKIMKIDLSDGTDVQTITAPAASPQGMTFDGTYLWCADRMTDEIYAVDPASGEVIVTLKAPGPYARGLAWDGTNLWCSDYQRDSIYQIVRKDNEMFHLENTKSYHVSFIHEAKVFGKGSLRSLDVYVGVPENQPQQKILAVSYSPANPPTVKDKWSQHYAHFNYTDQPSESVLRTTMSVDARISEITYFVFPDQCGKLSDIPSDIRKTYTANDTKYLIDDPYIQRTAKEVVGSEKNPYWIARKIFDFVRNKLDYLMVGGWNAAPVVLQRGTGSCSEYSFSFIALCRAAGLPARYVGSIVVRGDDKSLDEDFHRWPEVYLPNYGWIPFDPQGGDKPSPRDQAMAIGHLPNRFLITTRSGGNSEYMGWYYNSNESWKADPQVQVNIESFGLWEPLRSTKITDTE